MYSFSLILCQIALRISKTGWDVRVVLADSVYFMDKLGMVLAERASPFRQVRKVAHF